MTAIAAKKCPPPGAPMWVTTFADLMSLLMCFFVLLLSFSEMDIIKYKQIAGSLKAAFGVQRVVETKTMPKGTSIIAQEFSPGRPDPTSLKVLQQQTTDETKENLDFTDAEVKGGGEADAGEEAQADTEAAEAAGSDRIPEDNQSQRIKDMLSEEIEQGLLDVETQPGRTVIRIQEKGSFPSGSADLTPLYAPVMNKIARVLDDTRGEISVAGHTDDVPISTTRFRSNWELSAARSVTVVHHLLSGTPLDPGRFLIEGHADSQPLADNDEPQGRARNRRVEIVVRSPEDQAASDPPMPPGPGGQAPEAAAAGASAPAAAAAATPAPPPSPTAPAATSMATPAGGQMGPSLTADELVRRLSGGAATP